MIGLKNKKIELDEEVLAVSRDEEAIGNKTLGRIVLVTSVFEFIFSSILSVICWIFDNISLVADIDQKQIIEDAAQYENIFRMATLGLLVMAIVKFFCYAWCKVKKGKSDSIKYLFIYVLLLDSIFSRVVMDDGANFIFLIPVVFSCFYFDNKFTKQVSLVTIISYCVTGYLKIFYGQVDLNTITISQDTMLYKDRWLYSQLVEAMDREQYRIDCIDDMCGEVITILMVCIVCVEIAKRGHSMAIRQNNLSKKNAAIRTELSLAADIQKNMIPSDFSRYKRFAQFKLFGIMEPAKDVGGDFYDFYMPDNDHLVFIMADVCGKGVPAALFMSKSKTCLADHISSLDLTLTEAVNRTNNMMMENNPSMTFVTAWIGVLDIHTGKVKFINAGHTKPILIDKDGNEKNIEANNNMIIGTLPFSFVQNEFVMEKGDRIFLCTDGVYEAHEIKPGMEGKLKEEDLYGRDRAVDYIRKHHEESMDSVINGLKNDVDDYVKHSEPFDDITMLMLNYLGE